MQIKAPIHFFNFIFLIFWCHGSAFEVPWKCHWCAIEVSLSLPMKYHWIPNCIFMSVNLPFLVFSCQSSLENSKSFSIHSVYQSPCKRSNKQFQNKAFQYNSNTQLNYIVCFQLYLFDAQHSLNLLYIVSTIVHC